MADAFAAFLLRSFTKFTTISFRLLHPTSLYNESGGIIATRLYWDGTIEAYTNKHVKDWVHDYIMANFG